jgi:transposase
VPSPRSLSFSVTRRPADRRATEQQRLDRLKAGAIGLRTTIELAERFGVLFRTRREEGLEEWLTEAQASGLPEYASLARSLRQDEAAVRAGLSLAWSNGPVEGAVNRLRLIKRSMFGRAGFQLLRARVLRVA